MDRLSSFVLKEGVFEVFWWFFIDGVMSSVSFIGVLMWFQAMQARHYAAKERSRAPITPATSKVKKYKLKSFS